MKHLETNPGKQETTINGPPLLHLLQDKNDVISEESICNKRINFYNKEEEEQKVLVQSSI